MMTTRTSAILAAGTCLLFVLAATPSLALTNCDTTKTVPVSETLSDNYESTTGSAPCIEVTGSGVTLNCGGKEIRCSNSSDCATAIKISASNVTLKNCLIVSNTGDWTTGVGTYDGFLSFYNADIFNIVVQDADIGVSGGGSVKDSVFSNMGLSCVNAGGFLTAAVGMDIQDNYCDSADDGFIVRGRTTGAAAEIDQNYVRATNAGIEINDGIVDIEKNIIDAATPLNLVDDTDVTLTSNICDDIDDCPDPDDYPFGINLTINFQ